MCILKTMPYVLSCNSLPCIVPSIAPPKACEKRPVSLAKLEEIVEEIESKLQDRSDKELNASKIGQLVMRRLKTLDKVAYVRFASVYREFKDVDEFKKELESLLKEK